MQRWVVRAAAALFSAAIVTQAAVAGVKPAVPFAAQAFDLKDVRLLDGPFKTAQQRDIDWLLRIDMDRLLAGFREDAGLKPKAEKYGGWERMGIAGHSLGHHLSACALMYGATGDERFKQRVNYIVSELAECQNANGDGYVAAIPNGKRVFAEVSRGDIRSKGFDLNGSWVPWYTIHKQLAGLRDAYLHCGSDQALEVWKNLCDWALKITDNLSPEQINKMLRCEHGGMNESASDLYAITGEQRYLTLAQRFNDKQVMDPLADGKDILGGLHANTQVPKMVGAARQYELTGEEYFKKTASFFWQTVTRNHSYANGANSDGEHFGQPGKLSRRLGSNTAETCNTYNMLRLSKHLFTYDASPAVADYYELALYNHILASQEQEGRVTYYCTLKPGAAKEYQTLFDSWSCCVGTGMENHAKYGEGIYFHSDDALWVNLFIASTLEWKEKGLTLTQETSYPDSESSKLKLKLKEPAQFTVKIRHPAWANKGMEIKVNGQPQPTDKSAPGTFQQISRTWADGDVIEINLPMSLRLVPMPDNADRTAILYGPVMLSADLGSPEELLRNVPVIVAGDRKLEDWLKPVAGRPLTFQTVDAGKPTDLTLIPYFRQHHQRGQVYFDLFSEEQWAKREAEFREQERLARELEARTIDIFQPGEMQPERDHNFEGEKTRTGSNAGKKWRDAYEGGWFAFTMKVDPKAKNQLVVTYYGSDGGGRDFDVLIDDQKVATVSLKAEKPEQWVDARYDLPGDLVGEKTEVRVKFQAHPNNVAGGVFGARMIRTD